jgi:putative membrane protein
MIAALPVLVAAVVAVVAYSGAVRRLRRRGGRWPAWKEASAGAGVAVIAFGVTAPLGDRFSGHVIEHLLLGLAGPALVAAGSPITLLLRSSPPPTRRRVRRALRAPVIEVATHPIVAVALAVLGPWVVWLSPLDGWQRDLAVVHVLVHVHLVIAGLLFGVAILGLDHTRWRRAHGVRLLAAAVALPLHALLGLVILSASTPFLNPTIDGAAALDDQRLGAALLWVVGDGIATVAMLVVGLQWAASERRIAVAPVALSAAPVVPPR